MNLLKFLFQVSLTMALIGATNQQKIKILQELNETHPNKCEENKEVIQQWMKMQPHLPKNYGKFEFYVR